jgi:superfamily I DNA/RNA helicase
MSGVTRPALAPAQRQVVTHGGGPLLVLGGPGTGKTTALVELVARRVEAGLDPSQVLMMAARRRSAARLRDRVALRLGRTIREPVARTAHSYAFGLLRQDAVRRALPPPRLLSGAEQELMISEMLAGRAADWPSEIRRALLTRSFAGQLRDLLLRLVERGLGPTDLAALGRAHDRPLWLAAAGFAAEYHDVTALAHPSAYDPAELVRAAVGLLRTSRSVRESERAQRRLVVVDEFSEADPALVDLLDELAGGGGDLVVAGDPDTSVFGFRGADPAVLLDFPARFPGPTARRRRGCC